MPRLTVGNAYVIENIECIALGNSQSSLSVYITIGQKVKITNIENKNIYFQYIGETFVAQEYCFVDQEQWANIKESVIKEYKRLKSIKRNAKASRNKRSNLKNQM